MQDFFISRFYNIETNQQLSSNGTSTLDASFLTFRLNSFISHGNVWMNAVRILFIFQSSFSVLINTICHFFVPTLEIFKLAKKTKLPNKNCQSVVFWQKMPIFFTSMPSKPNNGNGLDLSFLNILWLSWTVEYMFLGKKLKDYVHPWNRFHGMNTSETIKMGWSGEIFTKPR